MMFKLLVRDCHGLAMDGRKPMMLHRTVDAQSSRVGFDVLC
jgi:hypothetical protein